MGKNSEGKRRDGAAGAEIIVERCYERSVGLRRILIGAMLLRMRNRTLNRSGKTSPILVLVVVLLMIGGAGATYYLTRSDDERKSLDAAAEKAKLLAEVQVTKQRITMYKAFVKACDEAKKGLKSDPPKYEGYDAFSYSDEGKYRSELGAQEARLGDLNARLGGAFNK